MEQSGWPTIVPIVQVDILIIFYVLLIFLQILNVCLEEMLFDKSLLLEDFNKAKCHLDNVTSLDHHSGLYRYDVPILDSYPALL